MKTIMKTSAKGLAKGKSKGVVKPCSSVSVPKLTKESLRAHETLIAQNLKSADEILDYMEKLPPKDKEQIWKQHPFCI